MAISIGIIGTGKIVERGTGQGSTADKRCKVIAIAGRNAARLEELSVDFPIPNQD